MKVTLVLSAMRAGRHDDRGGKAKRDGTAAEAVMYVRSNGPLL
jgi:hypothetical protein